MRSISESPSIAANGNEVTPVPRRARLFTIKLITVVSALHTRKTAEWLAHAAHCSVRAAKNYLSGKREWSGAAVNAVYRDLAE
jgi:hypothetical protein